MSKDTAERLCIRIIDNLNAKMFSTAERLCIRIFSIFSGDNLNAKMFDTAERLCIRILVYSVEII